MSFSGIATVLSNAHISLSRYLCDSLDFSVSSPQSFLILVSFYFFSLYFLMYVPGILQTLNFSTFCRIYTHKFKSVLCEMQTKISA